MYLKLDKMKQIYRFIFIVFIAIIIQSCHKDNEVFKNNGIIGKWKLLETYDGYQGGNYKWNKTPENRVIEFTIENKYFEYSDNQISCQGSYTSLSDKQINMNNSCSTDIYTINLSELTETYLIIDHIGREGITRDKYIAIK